MYITACCYYIYEHQAYMLVSSSGYIFDVEDWHDTIKKVSIA